MMVRIIEQNARAKAKALAKREKKRKTHCVTCGKDIMHRGHQAKYCEDCAKDSVLQLHRKYHGWPDSRKHSECQECGRDIRDLHRNSKYCKEHQGYKGSDIEKVS